jgi:uncharacterized protein (TIGR02265 family)
MTEYKGTAVAFLRTLIAAQTAEARAAFEKSIAPADLEAYRAILPVSTVSIQCAANLYSATAAALHPTLSLNAGLRRVGRAVAEDNLSGIYRIVLKVLSVRMLIDQCAKLWRTYHSTGIARSEKIDDQHYLFIVADSPDLPESYREFVCGYIEGAVALTGGKNSRVTKGGHAQEWQWDVTWQ